MKTIKKVLIRIAYFYGKFNPKWLAGFLYYRRFKRKIDWINPTFFNEKLYWMSFYSNTEKWILLSDKYKVRQFLINKGYGRYLTYLYGVYENADLIDFSILPNQFVLKTNHGSGEVIVVKNKSKENLDKVKIEINNYLKTPFGYRTAEIHYLKIKPCIIAEQLLENDSVFSTSIVDYKFYCFGGEPKICGVFFDRNLLSHQKHSAFYDMSWHIRPEWKNQKKMDGPMLEIPCPKCFEEMKKICRELTSDFLYHRVCFFSG